MAQCLLDDIRRPFRSPCLFVLIASFIACECVRQHKYEWRLDDLVSDCRPWVSVQVRTDNSTGLHNITLTQSTSSVINHSVVVHTSRSNFTARHRAPCLYQGSLSKTGDPVFASERRERLKMTFKYNDTWYRAVSFRNSSEPAIARSFEPHEANSSGCHYKIPPREWTNINGSQTENPGVVRKKRALTLDSFQDSAVTKVLELAVVIDRSFVNKAGSEGNAVSRVLQITNYANGAYQKFNLRLVLTNIFVWSADVFTITNSPDDTLNSFTLYKMTQVAVKYDTIILLSAVQWNGGTTLGLAWMKGLCDRLFAAGIVSDKYSEAISTAWTLTHEIGHNLGLSHVEDIPGCTCSKTGGCIMNSYLSPAFRLTVLDWSTCALSTWKSEMNDTWRSCLADAPATSYYSTSSPMCGNGILETGEQCDCGPSETCTSPCCDASTCRLKSGATCASGSCCDWSTCSLRLRGDVCRASNGPCDVAETCTGSSEWCPSDDKVADGVDCASGQAFCYKGQCKTTDSQCQLLYSSTARTADSQCFSLNNRGNVYGHCSMQLDGAAYISGAGFNRSYSFAACSSLNTGCGLLQCYDTGVSIGSVVTLTTGAKCYTQPRLDFSSSGLRSPGFVPDGAKCAANSMCINSVCSPVSTVSSCPTCPNCNGQGVLTQSKLCFCNVGFAPPNCSTVGCGGSTASPLAFFDPNRTTIRPPTTTTYLTSTTPSGNQNSSTIFGLQMWQLIAILAGVGAVLLIIIISVSVHCAVQSQRKSRVRRAGQSRGQARSQPRHPPPAQMASRPSASSRSRPPPVPPPPQLPPMNRSPASGINPAFLPDDYGAPPPPPYEPRVQPSAPPPPPPQPRPSFHTGVPSVYTVPHQQAWPEHPPPSYR